MMMSEKYSCRWRSCICLSCLLLATSVQAVVIRKFDTDLNGIISAEEYRAFLIARTDIPMRVLDENSDGEISSEELEWFSSMLEGIDERVQEFRNDSPHGLDIVDFNRQAGLTEEIPVELDSWFERSGLLVRGKLESVTLFSEVKPLSGASSATFSYSQNLANDTAWSTLKGVVMRPFRNEQRPNLVFSPSISFNRVNYTNNSLASTDTLIFRLSADQLFPRPKGTRVTAWTLRANPALITDTDFGSLIVSLEFTLQPTAPTLGIGNAISVGSLELRWQTNALLEYGHVYDRGDNVLFVDDENLFGRLGPSVDLDVWFSSFENLKASVSWQFLKTIVGEQRSRKYADVVLSLALDKSGHLSAQMKYINGDSSAKLENEEQWTFGLGIKY